MNINKFTWAVLTSTIIFTTVANALLGPIPIYLNTEYRTESPVIGSIASTIKLSKGEIQQTGVNTFTELLVTIPSVSFEGGQEVMEKMVHTPNREGFVFTDWRQNN